MESSSDEELKKISDNIKNNRKRTRETDQPSSDSSQDTTKDRLIHIVKCYVNKD